MNRSSSVGGGLTRAVALHFPFLLSLAVASSSLASVLIPIEGPRDQVFDSVHNILYVGTSHGTIERYDVASSSLLTPFVAGTSTLNGMDITLDGQFLYVADGGQYGARDVIRKFNTTTGELTNLFFDRRIQGSSTEGEAWDVAVTNAGYALITTDFNGSGTVPRRTLDLASDMIARVGTSEIYQKTRVVRSGDGALVIWAYGNVSPGNIFTYDPATQAFPHGIEIPSSLTNIELAVNRDGSLISYGGTITNSRLSKLKSLTGIAGGIGFNPVYDVFYGVDINDDHIISYDTHTFNQLEAFSVGEDISFFAPFGSGGMSLSGDGRLLFLTTPSGVRMFNVVASVPEPSTLALTVLALAALPSPRRKSVPHNRV